MRSEWLPARAEEWEGRLWRRWHGEGNESESGPHTLFSYSALVLLPTCVANLGCRNSPSVSESVSQRVPDGPSEFSPYLLLQGQCLPCRCVSQQRVSICIVTTLLMGKDWARAALLSITCLITPPMMKGSGSNLVIAKSLMSLGLRAARAGGECRSSRRVSLRSYCCTTAFWNYSAICGGDEGKTMLNGGVSETENLSSAIHGMQIVSPESLAAAQASVSLGEAEET